MPTETELTVNNPGLDRALTSDVMSHDSVFFPTANQTQLAKDDIRDGLKSWRIWWMLAYQDIKLRYRRSILGPFWLTISMAITIYSMGYLYAHLFHIELAKYYPFLVAGMLGWSLISTIVLEYTDGFLSSEGLIKQIKLPYSLHIHRIICRNIIIFFHNILVIIPILIIFHETAKVNLNTLLLIPGLLIIYINAISYGLVLSMIGVRYRDISQIIKSLIQVAFFITPVMWGPEVLGPKNQFIVDANPFYAFLELIRQPLLGHAPTLKNIVMVVAVTLFGFLISAKIFSSFRARIIYWL
jgi:ABC-type polysaccharide/polyol phosphate export permease